MKKFFFLTAFAALIPAFGQSTTTPLISDVAAARLLDQATWGPTPPRFNRFSSWESPAG